MVGIAIVLFCLILALLIILVIRSFIDEHDRMKQYMDELDKKERADEQQIRSSSERNQDPHDSADR